MLGGGDASSSVASRSSSVGTASSFGSRKRTPAPGPVVPTETAVGGFDSMTPLMRAATLDDPGRLLEMLRGQEYSSTLFVRDEKGRTALAGLVNTGLCKASLNMASFGFRVGKPIVRLTSSMAGPKAEQVNKMPSAPQVLAYCARQTMRSTIFLIQRARKCEIGTQTVVQQVHPQRFWPKQLKGVSHGVHGQRRCMYQCNSWSGHFVFFTF
jgi:hypothetical protein